MCLNYNWIKRSPSTRMKIPYMPWAKDLPETRSANTNPVLDSCWRTSNEPLKLSSISRWGAKAKHNPGLACPRAAHKPHLASWPAASRPPRWSCHRCWRTASSSPGGRWERTFSSWPLETYRKVGWAGDYEARAGRRLVPEGARQRGGAAPPPRSAHGKRGPLCQRGTYFSQ